MSTGTVKRMDRMDAGSKTGRALKWLVALVALAGLVLASPVAADGRLLSATLTGAAEVPGPGDADGTGSASIRINSGQRRVCFELSVSNIAPATAAHIHVGEAGVAGPIVITLDPPTSGSSSGCVSDVDPALLKAIRKDPAQYYVNVHNAEFPGGAVRGQLSK